MSTAGLLQQTEEHVLKLFEVHDTSSLLYHNLKHTQEVVKHSKKLADYYQLSEHSGFILLTAAWFHDTGQLTGDMRLHEENSVRFMQGFLQNRNIDHDTIADIAKLIMATKMPVAPVTQLEKIICDADTWHLGTPEFQQLDKLVWLEMENRTQHAVIQQQEKSLAFLQEHRFYTSYCIAHLDPGKMKNIEQLTLALSHHHP